MKVRAHLVGTCCGILLLFANPVTFAELAESRKQELQELRLLPYKEFFNHIHSFTTEEREFLIEEQRKFVQDQENDPLKIIPPDEIAFAKLWRLGDDYGLEKYVGEFIESFIFTGDRIGPALAISANPRVIEKLAQELFHDEPAFSPVMRSSDALLNEGTLSGESARIIWIILSESPEFSGEVTNWARKTENLRETNWGPLKEVRDVLREWWPKNEEFFKARNYKAVQPGRDILLEETAASEPFNLPTPMNGTSGQDNLSPVAATLTGASPPVANDSRLFLFTSFALGAVMLLGGILFKLKRRA